MNFLSFILCSLLFLSACATSKPNSQRGPASDLGEVCGYNERVQMQRYLDTSLKIGDQIVLNVDDIIKETKKFSRAGGPFRRSELVIQVPEGKAFKVKKGSVLKVIGMTVGQLTLESSNGSKHLLRCKEKVNDREGGWIEKACTNRFVSEDGDLATGKRPEFIKPYPDLLPCDNQLKLEPIKYEPGDSETNEPVDA